MCVSKVQHATGRKTGCNRSRPVFFGFSIFRQPSQLATEKNQNLRNRNRWSGLLRLGSVRFRSFFQSSELDLRTLIKSTFQDPLAKKFHFFPFKLFWRASPDSPPEHVITEVYNSDAYLEEHEKLKSLPHEPGCNLETVITAILIYSDSTHLTNFGTASLWLIYVFFGNLSKYICGLPTLSAAHHLAYMPSVCFSFFCLGHSLNHSFSL